MGHSFPTHFPGEAPKKKFSSLSQSLSGELFAWSMATHSLLLGRLHFLPRIPRPLDSPLPPPPRWSKNKPTYHIIMITNFITISFKMLKKSTISLACSPIFPMAMPKAMKNPIRPVGWITLHRRADYTMCFFSLLHHSLSREPRSHLPIALWIRHSISHGKYLSPG